MYLKKNILAVLLALGFVAGSTASYAADAVVAVPAYGTEVEYENTDVTGVIESDALVFQEGIEDESEVLVVTPDGSRTRADVEHVDGNAVVALDGEALMPSSTVEPTGYSWDTHDVYRVYDCSMINSNFEWDACEGPPTQ